MKARKQPAPKRGEQASKGQGWFCAGCDEHHGKEQERFEAAEGRWLCWPRYDQELNTKLANERDTLA